MNGHNLDHFVNDILKSELSPKQYQVLTDRFGLRDGRRKTLQLTGDKLSLTRERVRQIENQSLEKVAPKIKEKAAPFLEAVSAYLKSVGGVRKDDYFVSDLKNLFFRDYDSKSVDANIRFVFFAVGKPLLYKEDDNFHPFWYSDEKTKEKLIDSLKKAERSFRKNKSEKFFKSKAYLNLCPDFRTCHQLTISKKFGMNPFGEVGLVSWSEIDPRTVREKIHLVLKKHGEPLHFESIAGLINKWGLGEKKRAHPQTVHNELIKDNRFVLVGRGTYALKDQGYEPGTAREVIAKILKNKGPLDAREVVRLVRQKRLVKENTVLINLQNRRHFKRMDDGRYHLV